MQTTAFISSDNLYLTSNLEAHFYPYSWIWDSAGSIGYQATLPGTIGRYLWSKFFDFFHWLVHNDSNIYKQNFDQFWASVYLIFSSCTFVQKYFISGIFQASVSFVPEGNITQCTLGARPSRISHAQFMLILGSAHQKMLGETVGPGASCVSGPRSPSLTLSINHVYYFPPFPDPSINFFF